MNSNTTMELSMQNLLHGQNVHLDPLSEDRMRILRDRQTLGRLRRSTLVALRWTAVLGQIFAIIVTLYVLKFDLNVWPCLALVGASAMFNTVVTVTRPLDRRVTDLEAITQLGFDVFQLGALLYLTGGMQNPFALLFIAPAVTSATTLRPKVITACLIMTSIVSATLLFYHHDLPWRAGETIVPRLTLTVGSWIALMVGISFTCLYAWRAAGESRRMSNALAATEAVLAQEQKLAALGSMAAAAAHELGTPLGTIQVTAKEMSIELPENTPLGEDARLVLSQARRCREILQGLGKRGDASEPIHDRLPLSALLIEITEPFENFGRDIQIDIPAKTPMLELRRLPELIYSLTNLIENAIDFSVKSVTLQGSWDDTQLFINIADDGPGFDPVVRNKLGEPYVSSRPGQAVDFEAGGLGLGIFIAKTLIQRLGGDIRFGNHKDRSGAYVSITLPLDSIQAGPQNY